MCLCIRCTAVVPSRRVAATAAAATAAAAAATATATAAAAAAAAAAVSICGQTSARRFGQTYLAGCLLRSRNQLQLAHSSPQTSSYFAQMHLHF